MNNTDLVRGIGAFLIAIGILVSIAHYPILALVAGAGLLFHKEIREFTKKF